MTLLVSSFVTHMFVPSKAIASGELPTRKVPSVAPVGECAVARAFLHTPAFRDATGARGARQSLGPVALELDEAEALAVLLPVPVPVPVPVPPPAPAAPPDPDTRDVCDLDDNNSGFDNLDDGEPSSSPHPAPIAMATQTIEASRRDIPDVSKLHNRCLS